MNARTDFSAEPSASSERAYGITFGTFNQSTPWTDVRQVTWTALARLLTTYGIGRKEGTCVVPARFRGEDRKSTRLNSSHG